MKEVLCVMALKSANGRQNHHTQAGLHVCCERALKRAGERNTHGRAGAGNRPRERSDTPGSCEGALHDMDGGDFACAALRCAGKLLTGNIGSLCEQQH
jgi:hypothetical protein